MSVIEMLRAYTLREYAVILLMAVLGGLGLVFMLNSMGGGAPSGETLLKREPAARKDTASLNFVEASAAAQARARAAAARRARIQAQHRQALAQRAARRARVVAARRVDTAPALGATRTAPQATAPAPTRVVNPAPNRSAPKAAPAPKPTPQKSGTSGGGGGSFDDSG